MKDGDLIIIVRRKPKYWQKKLVIFGIKDGWERIAYVKNGKIHHHDIDNGKVDHIEHICCLPKERKYYAEACLGVTGYQNTLELVNDIFGHKETDVFDYVKPIKIPSEGNLDFYA